jgi:hypothetical protein
LRASGEAGGDRFVAWWGLRFFGFGVFEVEQVKNFTQRTQRNYGEKSEKDKPD